MSTRAHIIIKDNDNTRHLNHHCDGYPSGVGSELSNILESCPEPWTAESVQKYINEQDDDYRISDSGIRWDHEYVYVIYCDLKELRGYYKGITDPNETFNEDYLGDQLLIPGNKFSSERDENEYPYKEIYDKGFEAGLKSGGPVQSVKEIDEWEQFRRDTAKEVIARLVTVGHQEGDYFSLQYYSGEAAKLAVRYADALVNELKNN